MFKTSLIGFLPRGRNLRKTVKKNKKKGKKEGKMAYSSYCTI